MSRLSVCLRGIVLFVAVGLSAARAAADTLAEQIQHHVPDVLAYLQDRGVKTVGVLKFRVQKPGQRTSDSVGPLNSLLADRLEVGLILANPFEASRQLNIIKDASRQAETIARASHLSAAGRAAFFGPTFQLAWGSRQLPADAFLTGVVQVHDDHQHATVGILCFHRDGGKLEPACPVFQADLDVAALTEMGESFVLRGAFDRGRTSTARPGSASESQSVSPSASSQTTRTTPAVPAPADATAATESAAKAATGAARADTATTAATAAAGVRNTESQFPLSDPAAPVRLEITYDGQRMPIQVKDGRAFVREPTAGQRVEFAIVRTPTASGRLGVVLRVNGENTLYRQTQRDLDCSKWILTDAHRRTVIRGYQKPDGRTTEQFTVLSVADSAARAMHYGRSVGQIQLTVFREEDFLNAADLPPALPDEQEEDLAAILRATQPARTPDNLSALKHQVRTAGKGGTVTRGLIVQGQTTAHAVRPVTFVPDPTPVMSATITYFPTPR